MSQKPPPLPTRGRFDPGLLGSAISIVISIATCVLGAGAFTATSAAWWTSGWCFVSLFFIAFVVAWAARARSKMPQSFPLFVVATSLAGALFAQSAFLAILS